MCMGMCVYICECAYFYFIFCAFIGQAFRIKGHTALLCISFRFNVHTLNPYRMNSICIFSDGFWVFALKNLGRSYNADVVTFIVVVVVDFIVIIVCVIVNMKREKSVQLKLSKMLTERLRSQTPLRHDKALSL